MQRRREQKKRGIDYLCELKVWTEPWVVEYVSIPPRIYIYINTNYF